VDGSLRDPPTMPLAQLLADLVGEKREGESQPTSTPIQRPCSAKLERVVMNVAVAEEEALGADNRTGKLPNSAKDVIAAQSASGEVVAHEKFVSARTLERPDAK
jgi:hypothetical protein